MMTWGAGSNGWLWMLAGLSFVVGVVLVVWAIQRAGGGPEDDAMTALRARFARGEIDAAQFEEMRRVLGSIERPRGRDQVGLLGLVLIVGALVAWIVAGASGPSGWNWGWGGTGRGGMMGPGGMMGIGAGPTAPADTSVRMAGSRFEPSTLTVAVGETVRWFNDDALPHTVSATDGSWESGNLAPGQAFERRFDTAGSYPYLCRYHPGMTGTIEVSGP